MQLRAYHTLDGGKTFKNATNGLTDVAVISGDFSSAAHGYAAVIENTQRSSMIFYA